MTVGCGRRGRRAGWPARVYRGGDVYPAMEGVWVGAAEAHSTLVAGWMREAATAGHVPA